MDILAEKVRSKGGADTAAAAAAATSSIMRGRRVIRKIIVVVGGRVRTDVVCVETLVVTMNRLDRYVILLSDLMTTTRKMI
jgi:hypothetical protein